MEVLEKKKNKLKLEIESMTLVNLLNENIWQQKGIKFAAWTKRHPYMSKPEIIVKADEPKKKLIKAANKIIKDVEDLEKQVK